MELGNGAVAAFEPERKHVHENSRHYDELKGIASCMRGDYGVHYCFQLGFRP